ncbi:MAG: hypothetical protein IIW63_04680 [Clostridia bacterium]|nr:hypothetical protein [Clostridia bacterium]
MANYKYSYNEEPAPPPPEEVKEYKHYTVYPNNVLIMGILSLIFSGLIGVVLALWTLQKEKIYRTEHEGETCTKVKIGRILAIISLVMLGVSVAFSLVYYIAMIIINIMYAPEEVSQLYTYIYPFI